jgi:hypothetical protein
MAVINDSVFTPGYCSPIKRQSSKKTRTIARQTLPSTQKSRKKQHTLVQSYVCTENIILSLLKTRAKEVNPHTSFHSAKAKSVSLENRLISLLIHSHHDDHHE